MIMIPASPSSQFVARLGRGLLVTVLLLGGLVSPPLLAATTDEVQSLIREDRLGAALDAVEKALAEDADNVEMRFLKGLILTRQDRLGEAAKVFQALIDDYPKLPEPYNNLAVVYAAQGEYDKARETLLRAINTHPSYATAYENIGDIYAKMASDAYNQALELDNGNSTAREKLALVNDLFPGESSRSMTATAADEQPAKQPAEQAQQQAQADEPEPARPTAEMPGPAMTRPASDTDTEEAPAESAASGSQADAEASATAREAEVEKKAIEQAVRDWAAAWSAQDVAAYLNAYADDFLPPDDMTRDEWRAQRRERLSAPAFIEVDIDDLRVSTQNAEQAKARFRQTYRSDTYGDEVMKTLLLKRVDERWLITEEHSE